MDSRSCPMARGPWSTAIGGGFVRVEVSPLLRAWRACLGHPGGGTDFRIWLTLREVRVRRAAARVNVPTPGPRWRAELTRLCDLGDRRVAQGVRRLAGWGLIAVGDEATIPGDPDPLLLDDHKEDASGRVDDSLPRRGGGRGNPQADLAVLGPVRATARDRAGAGGAAPVPVAAQGRVGVAGSVEDGLGCRRVRGRRPPGQGGAGGPPGARVAPDRGGRTRPARVEPLGPGPPDRPRLVRPGRQTAPQTCRPGRRVAPPLDLHPAPLPGEKDDPEPGDGRVAAAPDPGDRLRRGIALVPDTQSHLGHPRPDATPPPAPVARPDLRAITVPDLRDVRRTLILHEQAVAAGWIGASEADRLRFVAAAVHAEGIATINPPGLFRALVVGRCWRRLTQRDEDEARRRLRAPHQPQAPSQSTSRSSGCVAQTSPRPLNALSALASRLGLGTEPYDPLDGM